jgi:hypothetical protein
MHTVPLPQKQSHRGIACAAPSLLLQLPSQIRQSGRVGRCFRFVVAHSHAASAACSEYMHAYACVHAMVDLSARAAARRPIPTTTIFSEPEQRERK